MKPDKGNNNGNNNKRNIMGLVSIIFWALLFTMMIKSCTSSYANMGTVEVPYTTFKEWLAEDKIDTVNVENGKYTFTLRDGVEVELPREETSGGSGSLMNSLIPVPAQTEEEKQYITVPLAGVDDPELLAMLEEHADHAYTEPVDESAYFLSLILSYVLPLLLMVGLMMFLFRGIGGKGGMGGLGGVGKANAKVYVEKKTGVTFRDVAPRNPPGDHRHPPQSPEVHGDRCQAAQGRSCWWPSGHRQDPAGQSGGWRGGRALLLHLRL